MANVENNNRIAGFVKKHIFAKRWVSIMLVIALLVTTVTMYALNKSATAVSEESVESVGMVYDTASTEGEDGATSEDVVVEETQEETSENETSESETVEATTEETTEEVTEETTTTESTTTENSESTESNESNEGDSESTTVAETENTSEESDTENTSEEAPASQAENTEETENTENTENAENTENTESDNSSEEVTTEDAETDSTLVTEETEEVKEENELTQDVVLTVSYKDENGENIADDKAINLENSIDFAEAAPKQEGYIFKDARLDDAVITKITVEYDVNMFKYYVITREDGSTEEVKEDKTVVLTYTKEEIAKSEIKLTAKFADKNGESIKEDTELKLTSELDVTKKENVDAIDNYFYMGATYNGEKIAKITPVTEKTEEAATEETENAESNTVSSYVITTKDGAEVSVTEDAEIVFTYYAAIAQTEFKVTNDKVTVTATLSAAGAFPEGIELNVTEVNAQTQGYNYDAYMQALNDNADKIAEANANSDAAESTEEKVTYDENNTILYDVAFMLEGIEYQPLNGSVKVKIEFNDKQLTDNIAAVSEEDITVVHLPIKEEVKEDAEITSTEEATDISASDVEVKPLTEATAAVEEEQSVEFKEDGFSIFAVLAYQSPSNGQYTVDTVLGDAVDFGIVTDTLYQKESQTNFAAGKVIPASGQTGNDYTNQVVQTFLIGEVDTSYPGAQSTFNIKGHATDKAFVLTPTEYTSKIQGIEGVKVTYNTTYTSVQIKKTVSDMLSYVRSASADLVEASKKKDAVKFELQSKLDVTGTKSKTVFVNVDLTNGVHNSILSSSEGLDIKKNSNQTIIFNISGKSEARINKFWVDNSDGNGRKHSGDLEDDTADPVAQTLIWNFIDADKVTAAGSVTGVFISGKQNAEWINQETSAGWIVFSTVHIGSEFHNTYGHIKSLDGKTKIEAYKNIAGSESKESGFDFQLSKLIVGDGANVSDLKNDANWEVIESAPNDRHNITFHELSYGNDDTLKDKDKYYTYIDWHGDPVDDHTFPLPEPKKTSFYYKVIEKSASSTLSAEYFTDSIVYYAKVDVTYKLSDQTLNNHNYTYCFEVSAPQYFTISESGQIQAYSGIPTFNNKPKAEIEKVWKDGNTTVTGPWWCLYVYVEACKPDGTIDTDNSQVVQLLQRDSYKKTIGIPANYASDGKKLTYKVFEINAFKNSINADAGVYDQGELEQLLKSGRTDILANEGSSIAGYTLSYTNANGNVLYTVDGGAKKVTLTNTKVPTKVIVKKVWGDNDPGAVDVAFDLQIVLLRKLEREADDKYQEVQRTTLTKGQLQVEFDNLPNDDGNGNKYVYSAAEYYGNQKFILNGDVINGFRLKAFTSSTDNNVTEIQFTNVPVIEIEKEWTEGGVTVTKENAKNFSAINVELYQGRRDSEAKLIGTYSLSSENDWHCEVEVTRGYSNGRNTQQYTYYIVEKDVAGMVTYYAYEGGTQKKSGTVASDVWIGGRNNSVLKLKVVNERGVNTLPSTGGSGTMPFAVGGLGIATLGLLGFEISRKKKRED